MNLTRVMSVFHGQCGVFDLSLTELGIHLLYTNLMFAELTSRKKITLHTDMNTVADKTNQS